MLPDLSYYCINITIVIKFASNQKLKHKYSFTQLFEGIKSNLRHLFFAAALTTMDLKRLEMITIEKSK
jgi:hypothetical protein